MATASKSHKPATMPTTRKRITAKTDAQPLRSLQQAIDEVDELREHAGDDLRRQLDGAVKRMRDVAGDLRERTDERTSNIERTVSRVADDAWQQLATLAIRSTRDADTLTELSNEIRKRRTQLRASSKSS